MRRVAVILFGIFVVFVAAAPALAQTRDPFIPLVSEADGATAPSGATTTTTEEVVAPATPSSEAMANTGVPAAQLLGLALALIGIGAVVTTIARPAEIPRR